MLVAFVSAVATFYFIVLVGGALLSLTPVPMWVAVVAAVGSAAAAARLVWVGTGAIAPGLARSILVGALVVGGIGFIAGFVGPIIFTPAANQGPLLGIFVTGPLGFLMGAISGGVHWLARARRGQQELKPGEAPSERGPDGSASL